MSRLWNPWDALRYGGRGEILASILFTALGVAALCALAFFSSSCPGLRGSAEASFDGGPPTGTASPNAPGGAIEPSDDDQDVPPEGGS